MPLSLRRLVFVTALTLLTLASAGFARASIGAIDALANSSFEPSGIPALLGPINELGRKGWHCDPEIAAKASMRRDAELPSDSESR